MTSKELQLRSLILSEHQAGQTIDQALKNIRDKIGFNEITLKLVKHWFKRFNEGQDSIFGKQMTGFVPTLISNEAFVKNMRAKFFSTADNRFDGELLTNDGRVGFLVNRSDQNGELLVSDLLHGTSRTLKSSDALFESLSFGDQMEFIDDDYLLMFKSLSVHLALLKIDDYIWKLNVCESTKLDDNLQLGSLVLDEHDKRRFVIYRPKAHFSIGHVSNDRIFIDKSGNFEFNHWHHTKLVGNKLCGFRTMLLGHNESQHQYCEFDLDLLRETRIVNFNATYGNEISFIFPLFSKFAWSENCLYIPVEFPVQQRKVLMLNTDDCKWTDTNVVIFDQVTGIFIDDTKVLTMKSAQNNFYRFQLKKPDTLKNLAWLSILHYSDNFQGQFYKRFAENLPYNTDLRIQVPNE